MKKDSSLPVEDSDVGPSAALKKQLSSLSGSYEGFMRARLKEVS
jgi:hypothetical protein